MLSHLLRLSSWNKYKFVGIMFEDVFLLQG